LTDAVKQLAAGAGFARAGVAPAGPLPADCRRRFEGWLAGGNHAAMTYLSRDVQKRFDPSAVVEGARGVICLAAAYAPPDDPADCDAFVARYARGRDYHKVLKRRCRDLMDRIRTVEPKFEGRAFVDSGRLAERSLAAAAGLGWIGRNGCLVVPGLGSYVVLAEIVCNLPLRPGKPLEPQCGDCRACLDACSAGACLGDGTIDARRCASYLTIEHDGDIDVRRRPAMGNCVFGCDRCQEVCPHNRNLPAGDGELAGRRGMNPAEILGWSADDWDAATRGSAMRRASREQFVRNAAIAAGNSGKAIYRPCLLEAKRRLPKLAEVIEWAVGRL